MSSPIRGVLFASAALAFGASGCGAAPKRAPPARAPEGALSGTPAITGDALPAKTLSLTFDDGPDAYTLTLARFLSEHGIKATFFINGCRFVDAPPPVIESGNCSSHGSFPRDLLAQLVALGHRVANHTEDHVDLLSHPELAISQLSTMQAALAPYIHDGRYFFRAPYNRWSAELASSVRAAPALRALVGPFHNDVDGSDWACPRDGKTPEQCGEQYLASLASRPAQNGIVQLHDRNEFCVGCDYTLRLVEYLLARLPPHEYAYVPLDAIPGLGTANAATRPHADAGSGL